jgi:cell shape-determining protein MreC
MARKKVTTSRGALFSRLLLASAVLLFLPHDRTKHINSLFFKAFDPVLTFAQGARPAFLDPFFPKKDVVTRRKYNNLYNEYANTLAKMATLHDNYDKLAGLRTNIPNANIGIVHADRIIASPSGRSEILIDKGRLDQVEKGQYVLVQEGNCVIGTVSETSESQAWVKLITDAKHNMPVLIWRIGTLSAIPAQLVGDGKGAAKIPLMTRGDDIKPGDAVFAVEKPGYLESRIIVGKISKVERDKKEPLLLDITVEPDEDYSDIKTVAVVVMNGDLRRK